MKRLIAVSFLLSMGLSAAAVPDAEQYQLRVDRLGYATTTLEVGHGESATVDLEVAAVPLPDIVVMAVLSPTAANEAIRPSAVFAGEEFSTAAASSEA